MSKCEITDAAMISIEQLNTFYRGRIILVLIALMTAAY